MAKNILGLLYVILWYSVIPILCLWLLCDHSLRHAIGYGVIPGLFLALLNMIYTSRPKNTSPEKPPFYKIRD